MKQVRSVRILLIIMSFLLSPTALHAGGIGACQLAQIDYWREFSLRTCYKKADEGDVFSQFTLANILYTGKITPRNLKRSLHYYRLAANNRHLNSMMRLGAMYMHGDGVEQDFEKAYIIFALADELGFDRAYNNLQRIFDVHIQDASEQNAVKQKALEHIDNVKAEKSEIIPWDVADLG